MTATITHLVQFTAGRAPLEALYANHRGYTDIDPFEVVKIMTPKKLAVRAMTATLDPTWKREFYPGGFFGHTANDRTQRWFYAINTDAPVFYIRLHKDGRWYDAHGGEYRLDDHPVKFYDHNF